MVRDELPIILIYVAAMVFLGIAVALDTRNPESCNHLTPTTTCVVTCDDK